MTSLDIPAAIMKLADMPDSGEETFSRRLCLAAGGGTLTSGALRLTYFTALRTESITKVCSAVAVAAGATPTICRIGIYTLDGSNNLTLAHSTTNDTAMWSSTATLYEKTLSSTFNKVAGTRYAIGALCVTGATAPTIAGMNMSNGVLQSGVTPRIAGSYGGQTDLPASVSAGSVSATGPQPWFYLKP